MSGYGSRSVSPNKSITSKYSFFDSSVFASSRSLFASLSSSSFSASASELNNISSRLLLSDAPTKVNAPFREAVGALMHLMTATRPDIAFAVGYVSRFMENPQVEHWTAVKRILRYLQGTKTHGIYFQPGNKVDFRGYSDADWAGDHSDRKSTSGYAFILMGNKLGKQETVKCVTIN